jgi:hypothetical protein
MPARSHRRTTTTKTRALTAPPARRETELAALTESGGAPGVAPNALGWDYLDAMSG